MKRRIITMVLSIVLLSLIVTYFKEENRMISYGLNDNPIAVMIYDEVQDTYVKRNNIPIGNYRLNEDKSYCTNGGEINHYNWATGTIQYTLDIGEKCYLYFYEETTPSYAIYSETDNSLIFYKNNDTVGSTYNGRVVTAKYDDIENSVYTYEAGTSTPGVTTPWYEYANSIKTISVANIVVPISTSCWFYNLPNAESINLTNLDTSQVTNMDRMFDRAGYNTESFNINLGGNFDTSNVTTMFAMFQGVGYNSKNLVLDLEDKFDTSNVVNMSTLFQKLAFRSLTFDLNLGDKFDTSNVTDMHQMFANMAYSSTSVVINLGNKFDTSNVIDMAQMFMTVGRSDANFTLDLGSKFDTSNVTDMHQMFAEVGRVNPNFNFELGNEFDTSKVTNMYRLFQYTGSSNPNFELDLSRFVIQSSCDLSEFIQYSAKKIIFGEGWANATLVSGMFKRDASTPLEMVNAPSNIQAYNFAGDNRVPTFTTI